MEKILNVAKYIVDTYKKISGTSIDEMKLHKLLYFTQRENLAITGQAMFQAKYVVNNIIQQYGGYEPWKLSDLSHKEYSWKQARIGIGENENGSRPIKIEDIREDAKKVRPYDSVYDMYYDEFEDADETEVVKGAV